MKDRSIAILSIGKNLSDRLAGTYLIACLHIDLAQIAVNRQIVTVTDNDRIVISRDNEHACHLAIEHGTSIRPRSGLDIDTAVIRTDILQFLMLLLAKGSDNRMATGHRIGQTALIACKIIRQTFLGFCHGISPFGIGNTFLTDLLCLRCGIRDFLA